jgi:hypothetical protein
MKCDRWIQQYNCASRSEPAVIAGIELPAEHVRRIRQLGAPMTAGPCHRLHDGVQADHRVLRRQVAVEVMELGGRPGAGPSICGEIPDDEYQTRDFERVIALRARTNSALSLPVGRETKAAYKTAFVAGSRSGLMRDAGSKGTYARRRSSSTPRRQLYRSANLGAIAGQLY